MEKKDILDKLKQLQQNTSIDVDTRVAVEEATKIVKKAKTREQCVKAIEILLKALGAGSNFF